MPKFFIEVPHDSDTVECSKAVQALLKTGSHWVTHAEWGCLDNVHAAWMFVEVESKAEAFSIVPPAFRARSRVVACNKFELSKIEAFLARHAQKQKATGA